MELSLAAAACYGAAGRTRNAALLRAEVCPPTLPFRTTMDKSTFVSSWGVQILQYANFDCHRTCMKYVQTSLLDRCS